MYRKSVCIFIAFFGFFNLSVAQSVAHEAGVFLDLV